ncbi:unnamed protein product [Adineta ricciae]|uniref:Uncharacterized protein n=1 Tax=Adineta ricciae TaxID=249248 RepID=A0A815ATX6_ADIRI|nr:unnamed protein product [Adineta ricciae]CAF1392909.1 unnamed protein product [Adineta ricciae]
MLLKGRKVHLLVILFIVDEILGFSYNRPSLSSDSQWNPNGTTIVNETMIGTNVFDLFIDENNTIYISNDRNGQILIFAQGNVSLIGNISMNLQNSSSLFVTKEEKIYVDTFYSSNASVVSEIEANSSSSIVNSILRMNICYQCFDIFVSENQTLLCSLSQQHQIISTSLLNQWDYLSTVAGTGSEGSTLTTLRYPHGIFLDENNSSLFVADCGNDRIQKFYFGSFQGETILSNQAFQLNCPSGITLDNQGFIFVVDSNNHRIVGQNSNGFRCLIGCNQSAGSNPNQLGFPTSLHFDSFGNLFVVDQQNHRIQKFDLIIYPRQWKLTGNMNVARFSHTTSILSNGKVLVTGGNSSTVSLNSAELYEVSTGNWTMTGNMSVARYRHTASILSDGKVLVTGGENGGIYLNSAELYDPSTSNWTRTGSMSIARDLHRASLLSDGKILVTGGETNGVAYINSAELYDPIAGNWTKTGDMNVARELHTVSVLSNGKVLVTGGYNGGTLNSAELYDPLTGNWTMIGYMNVTRYRHTASMLSDGKVLITGGYNGGTLNSAELYDPLTGNWTMTGYMSVPRCQHTASTLSDGKVLVTGGWSVAAYVNSAELYDPLTGNWTTAGNMSVARGYHAASVLSNKTILVTGGCCSLNSAELY